MMRNAIPFFAVPALALMLMLAARCTPEESAQKPGESDDAGSGSGPELVYEIVFDGGPVPAPVLEAEGGSATIGFTSAADWRAAKDSEADWLTISRESGPSGHAEITVSAAGNEDFDERNAAVTLTSGPVRKRFTITQKQQDALTVTSDKVELPAAGGRFEIELQTNAGSVEYEMEGETGTWIAAASRVRSMESRTLAFEARENSGAAMRQGRILLRAGGRSGVVTVYQSGIEPSMVLSRKEFTVPAGGGEVKIELQSNIGVDGDEPQQSWIHRVKSRSMSSYTYIYQIDENPGVEQREGRIAFKAGGLTDTVAVIQRGVEPDMILEQKEFTVPAAGGEVEIVLLRNIAVKVTGPSRSWIRLVETKGMTADTYLYQVDENTSAISRKAIVVFASIDGSLRDTVSITQKQKDVLTVSPERVEVPVGGGRFEIGWQSGSGTAEYEIAEQSRSWISGEPDSRGADSGTQTFVAEENPDVRMREGKIIFRAGSAADTVTVVQPGAAPEIAFAQTEFEVSADGEEVTVQVQGNVQVQVTGPLASWIRLADTRAGASCSFTFRIERNPAAKPRTASITFGDAEGSVQKSVTVTQKWKISADSFKWPNNEAADGITRAFPGAEGGGMYTSGGRGGRVIHVTNLNDSGAGSLRDAINQSGKRVIVFDVAGTIALRSELVIRNGDLTIAGQTAPGYGICVKNYTVEVDADNVIIRYMRFRLGDETAYNPYPQEDCLSGRYHRDIIIDHCTMTWSMDECASFYANRNFTMQWCLVGESLNASGHPKGEHGFGGIWGGRNASFHHNLLVHNKNRNARLDHPQIYGLVEEGLPYLRTHRGNVDYRNNLIYNWGDNATYGGEGGWFNIVGNYYKPGPSTVNHAYFVDANAYYAFGHTWYDYPRLYLEGNIHTQYSSWTSDQTKGVYLHDSEKKGNAENMFLKAPLPIRKDDAEPCYTTTHTPQTAFTRIVDYVGASLKRDKTDTRIIEETKTGTARYAGSKTGRRGIIDSPLDVGGWPSLTATGKELEHVRDSDGDGIPDYYEEIFGLDPENAADASDYTFDRRYTNLEMYLHYLVQDIAAAQVAGGKDTELR